MAGSTKTPHDQNAPAGDSHATTLAYDGNHATDVFPPFDSSTFGSQLVWLAISFAVLYIMMSRIALPRIGEILEVRRDRIEGDLAEAERLRQQTDQAIEAYEAQLADARRQAGGIAQEARDNMRKYLDEQSADIESELNGKLTAAENRIQTARTNALTDVKEIAGDTAHLIVTGIVGRTAQKTTKEAVAKVVKG